MICSKLQGPLAALLKVRPARPARLTIGRLRPGPRPPTHAILKTATGSHLAPAVMKPSLGKRTNTICQTTMAPTPLTSGGAKAIAMRMAMLCQTRPQRSRATTASLTWSIACSKRSHVASSLLALVHGVRLSASQKAAPLATRLRSQTLLVPYANALVRAQSLPAQLGLQTAREKAKARIPRARRASEQKVPIVPTRPARALMRLVSIAPSTRPTNTTSHNHACRQLALPNGGVPVLERLHDSPPQAAV